MARWQELIEAQQKGKENTPVYMVGEQLKEIASKEPLAAELLERDLVVDGMSISDAAAKLQEYSDKNHGEAKCFCIPPHVAEDILRKFYGIPARTEQQTLSVLEKGKSDRATKIDLSDFL